VGSGVDLWGALAFSATRDLGAFTGEDQTDEGPTSTI
jgi:hypothetical protein